MRAARLRQLGEPVRVEDVPIPDLEAGEVLLRVLRCALARSDVHRRPSGPVRPDDPVLDLPVTIGVDAVGEVVRAGPGVRGVRAGDRAIVEARLVCGICRSCRLGRVHLCAYRRLMGAPAPVIADGDERTAGFRRFRDGFWAEYARVPAANLVTLRPDDDLDAFAKITQAAAGYRAMRRGRLAAGETVVINGATGVTGTAALVAALALGAGRVIAVARNAARLARVRAIDPVRVEAVSVLEGPVRERVRELTDGEGANLLVDISPPGAESTVDCLQALERGGRAVLMGGNTQTLELSYRFVMLWAIEIVGTSGRLRSDIMESADLARRGIMDLSPMTPQYYRLEDIERAIGSFGTRTEDDAPTWPMMRAA